MFQRLYSLLRRSPSRIPVLTYHAAHAHGYDYVGNDHLALEEDLKLIRELRFEVVPLETVVDLVLGRVDPFSIRRSVAITFDDAPDCEYFDLYHPDFGCLKSFFRLLVESGTNQGALWPRSSAVSFVIASTDARVEIDRACLAGRGHWRDDWWHEASETGVLRFGNHSWDHAHTAVTNVRQRDQLKGSFYGIDSEQDADVQVLAAQRYIWFRTGGLAVPYFAYPYGEAPAYLRSEYFPNQSARHRIEAAFGTQGDYVTDHSDRWHIPRFVCGEHWRSTGELERILVGARGGS